MGRKAKVAAPKQEESSSQNGNGRAESGVRENGRGEQPLKLADGTEVASCLCWHASACALWLLIPGQLTTRAARLVQQLPNSHVRGSAHRCPLPFHQAWTLAWLGL